MMRKEKTDESKALDSEMLKSGFHYGLRNDAAA